MDLRSSLAELILLVPLDQTQLSLGSSIKAVQSILGGTLGTSVDSVLPNLELSSFCHKYPTTLLKELIKEICTYVFETVGSLQMQLVAISTLQYFVQSNFCGPNRPLTADQLGFNLGSIETLHSECIELLNLEGQNAYDYVVEPFFLVFSLSLFERLSNSYHLLLNRPVLTEEVLSEGTKFVENLQKADARAQPELASIAWWRARALQVHLSILSEPVDVLASLSSVFLQQIVLECLIPNECKASASLRQNLRIAYALENARNAIHAQTEHLAEPFLKDGVVLSQFQFVLTGAKAKRTKFQNYSTSSLILLAKSNLKNFCPENDADSTPQTYELNSDLLLEKPQYEGLEFEERADNDAKKIRLDNDLSHLMPKKEPLLPITMHYQDIPTTLRELDPNDQPALMNFDAIQLLLRLVIIKQTAPSGNAMIDEELLVVVSRIIYSSVGNYNWAVFSRALWERSILETTKARTVERGILQMTSLVEEADINIKSRTTSKDINTPRKVHSRLRYMHQLPLMGHWKMDAKLAEKYMALGVIKSAIAIYERLNMVTEAALCYAAVDEEQTAERLLEQRIAAYPRDARSISILGDIRQDPLLWKRAWEISHYAKAKASLSKYYYRPPMNTGLKKDLPLALKHMHDCLSASPLNYENWFFYGCCALESGNHEVAAEAFTRCVGLDDTNSHAWSNLASALLKLDKPKQALTALKRALQQGEGAKRSWRIFENFLLVAAKLGEWNDVLYASRELIKIRQEDGGEVALDIPVLEKLVLLLVNEPYPVEERLSYFQISCIDLICNMVPSVVNRNARVWRLVGRVYLWQGKPWEALHSAEKVYRATSLRPEINSLEELWNEAVEACSELVSAYESYGELPGKHGADDVVCKDWKFKARSSVRSLLSKGRATWEDSPGWQTLQGLKEDLEN